MVPKPSLYNIKYRYIGKKKAILLPDKRVIYVGGILPYLIFHKHEAVNIFDASAIRFIMRKCKTYIESYLPSSLALVLANSFITLRGNYKISVDIGMAFRTYIMEVEARSHNMFDSNRIGIEFYLQKYENGEAPDDSIYTTSIGLSII